jgi:hypothetical protein
MYLSGVQGTSLLFIQVLKKNSKGIKDDSVAKLADFNKYSGR